MIRNASIPSHRKSRQKFLYCSVTSIFFSRLLFMWRASHPWAKASVAVDVMPRMKSIHLDRKTPIFRAEKSRPSWPGATHMVDFTFQVTRIHYCFIFSLLWRENLKLERKKLHFKLDDWQIIFNFRKDVLTSENCKTAKSWMLDN